MLGVIASLLDLADGRLRASSLVDLAARSPVRRRFRFTDDDLELITDWVGRAGVRWGLDGDARSAFSLGESKPTPGAPGSTGCWSAWQWTRRSNASSPGCYPSTMSTPVTLLWWAGLLLWSKRLAQPSSRSRTGSRCRNG